MSEPQKPRTPLAGIVELRAIRLEQSESRFFGIKAGEAPKVFDYEIKVGAAKSPDNAQQLRALVEVHVKARAEAESTNLICTMLCRFTLDYEVPDEERLTSLTQEETVQFANTVPPHNAWPYIREYCHTITGRMGIPPLLLPTFRIKPSIKENGESPERAEKG